MTIIIIIIINRFVKRHKVVTSEALGPDMSDSLPTTALV